MNLRTYFALALIGLALAGCGEDNDDSSSTGATGTGTQEEQAATPSGPATSTIELSETEFKIEPAQPSAAKSGVVEFRVANRGQITHALEVEGGDIEEETEEIPAGGSATLKVDLKPGTYELYCPIGNHKEQGMEGSLTVGGGTGDAAGDDDEDSEERGEGEEGGDDDSLEGEAEGKGSGEDSGGATAPGGY